jgi:hypothetical protein
MSIMCRKRGNNKSVVTCPINERKTRVSIIILKVVKSKEAKTVAGKGLIQAVQNFNMRKSLTTDSKQSGKKHS